MLLFHFFFSIFEWFIYLKNRKISTLAITIFNTINLLKLFLDIVYYYAFIDNREQYLKLFNLPGITITDKNYLDRFIMMNIMVIRGGNAFMFITLPLIFFYMIRFLPQMNQNVPRFFIALKSILPITLIFMIIGFFLRYAYGILGNMSFYVENIYF